MSGIAPLAMSQTKDELVNHLNLHPETYALMAKEAEAAYKWLTKGETHLKKNCKRKPPYDWNDIAEKSKDEAIIRIAQGGNEYTSYYWNLATPTPDCPNWIARWFLYHKFRYRDGRNKGKSERNKRKNNEAMKLESNLAESSSPEDSGTQPESSGSAGQTQYVTTPVYEQPVFYDPVRDL